MTKKKGKKHRGQSRKDSWLDSDDEAEQKPIVVNNKKTSLQRKQSAQNAVIVNKEETKIEDKKETTVKDEAKSLIPKVCFFNENFIGKFGIFN